MKLFLTLYKLAKKKQLFIVGYLVISVIGFVLEIALAIMSVAVGLIVALAGSWMAVCFTGLVVMSVTVAASKACT